MVQCQKQFADHQTTSIPGIRIRTQPTGSGFTTTKLPYQNLIIIIYQNTIGERIPSIWAKPHERNFHRYVVGPR